MNVVSKREFERVYKESLDRIFGFWTEKMQSEIAEHCHAYRPGAFDFKHYLEASSVRFYHAYLALMECRAARICDVGGFWSVYPLTLKKLGFDITMTESLKYFSDAFKGLFEFVSSQGVKILDVDLFQDDIQIKEEPYDFVSAMAVIEHYPHSLALFMSNFKNLARSDGGLYLEVPNIAYFPKRMQFLKGKSPLADAGIIYRSKTPFIGHHHEYTIGELRALADLSELNIIKEIFFNYSNPWKSPVVAAKHPLQFLSYYCLKDSRECIAVLCRKKGG